MGETEGHHYLAWMCSRSSECVCVIQGERADRRSQPERPRQSQGSFVISPICSTTLSAEALVTLANTCKPSGFPTTAKTIVVHCGWCYKERRKTRGGLTTCPYDSRGFIHQVWSFNLTWKGDINTVASGCGLLTRTAEQLVCAAATFKQKQLWIRDHMGCFVEKKRKETHTHRNH